MDRRFFLGSALGVSSLVLLGSDARAAAPVFLGRRKVDPFLDRDVVHVGASHGLFRKVQFHVSGNDVFIYDINVDYTIGGNEHFGTRFKIPQGGFSRKLDLRFNKRFIRDVTFHYGKLPNGKGATHVELWGWR